MNSIEQVYADLLHGTHGMRNEMLASCSDDDLNFRVQGNPTLGELCRGMGEVQQSYIDSFKNFTQDFSYRHPNPAIATSVAELQTMFKQLDAELMSAIAALSEEDIQNKKVERGFPIALLGQVDVYLQAVLIFYGKVTVYFKAMGKALPGQWEEWIG